MRTKKIIVFLVYFLLILIIKPSYAYENNETNNTHYNEINETNFNETLNQNYTYNNTDSNTNNNITNVIDNETEVNNQYENNTNNTNYDNTQEANETTIIDDENQELNKTIGSTSDELSIHATSSNINLNPKTIVFSQWIIPMTNLSILDDTFEIIDVEDFPERLRIRKDSDTLLISKGNPNQKFGYEFLIKDYRFDLDKINIRGPNNEILYGTIDNNTRRILHSYYLQINLLKPIIEFRRTINNISVNNKPENLFREDKNIPLNVNLNILNYGGENVYIEHKEFIHHNFKIVNYSVNEGNIRFVESDNDNNYLLITGYSEDNIEAKYTLITEKDTEFIFDSKLFTEYDGIEYIFSERNITKLIVSPGIEFRGGFHNRRDFIAQETRTEIGNKQLYGIVIENHRGENITNLNLKIKFPDVKRNITMNNQNIPENIFKKSISLEKDQILEIPFNFTIFETGKHNILTTLEYYVNGELKKWDVNTTSHINFFPPKPNILFNSSKDNSTIDMLIFLSNSNELAKFNNLEINIETYFGENVEEYVYFFREIEIPSTLLLNRLIRNSKNSNYDYVIVYGSFETIYGQKIEFNNSKTIDEGYVNDYDRRLTAVFRQSNLDHRYEETVFQEEIPKNLKTLLTLTGMIVNEDNKYSSFVLPISILLIFILIQTVITKISKLNRKGNNKKPE